MDRLDFQDIDRCIQTARRKSGVQELVIAPTSEFLARFLLEQADFFASCGCTIPLVDLDLYLSVSDKHSCSRIFQREGVRVPRQLTGDMPSSFPFVAKPLANVTEDKRSLYPHLIYGEDDWARFRQSESSDEFYFEEFIVGSSFYLLCYLSRGGEVSAFSQQNLVQQPGGKSIVLATAAQVHTQPVFDKFVTVLKRLGFWGLAMIEVIQQDTEFVFIELNPRFWGPFQLLLGAGSPIIHRFIEDQLDLPPLRSRLRPDASYLWLGGIAESLAAGKQLVWHIDPPKHRTLFVAAHWRSDVYLQRDTGMLFLSELVAAAKTRMRRGPGG